VEGNLFESSVGASSKPYTPAKHTLKSSAVLLRQTELKQGGLVQLLRVGAGWAKDGSTARSTKATKV
jgi:hypothetical protein